MTAHRRALATVLRNALDAADARELLDMLGITEPGRHDILPDPDTDTGLRLDFSKAPGVVPSWASPLAQAEGRRPDNCTTPPGLRDLPPVVAAVKAPKRKAPKRRSAPPPRLSETERLLAAGVNPDTARLLGEAAS